jgi:branched-chain amino acid transport system ATP-binding protein
MPEPLLRVQSLCAGYGQVQVLWGADLTVERGSIACLVGSNGAGKSTLLRAISGLIKPTGGRVLLGNRDLAHATPDEVLTAGIAHVPEGRRLFKGLSVRDNLLLGAYLRREPLVDLERDLEKIYTLFPILGERQRQDATTLSGGEQQMCAIGRGMMARPRLLMIDELSLGLAPRVVERIADVLRELNRSGLTILLVEQDVFTAFELADHGCVLETGRISLAGATSTLADDPRIRQAYLGM